jgi:hypothetical protein
MLSDDGAMRGFGIFALWASVLVAFWLTLSVGQMFFDVAPLQWLVWPIGAGALIHAVAAARKRKP